MNKDPNAIPEGWCDFQNFLIDMAEYLPSGGTYVEVGVWLGQSLIYLGDQVRGRNKDVHLIGVDHFSGSPEEPAQQNFIARMGGPDGVYTKCLENIAASKLRNVSLYRMESTQAARLFDPGSLDAVFLDGSHDYRSVVDDIQAWRDKVKTCGGYLCGHDADCVDVRRALKTCFGEDYDINQTIWFRRQT